MGARELRGIVLWVGSIYALVACPAGDDDGTGVTSNSGPSSVSNEDGPEPVSCEQLGGTCDCVGSCGEQRMPSAGGTCPQPPDESGACSQECCVPVASTSTAGTASGTAGTASGTAGTASGTADSSTSAGGTTMGR